MSTDYSDHAAFWDWDEYDDSPTYDFWLSMSKKYGGKILSVMCAIGQAAVYMAQKGCQVTALDYTAEMVAEGEKRFSKVAGLSFTQADICGFDLKEHDFDFCFIAGTDIHLLPSLNDVKNALMCIRKHLRLGGGLGLGLWYADTVKESFSSPMRRFDPRVPRKDGLYIWKEGESHFNTETKTQNIHQIIHVDDPINPKSIDHRITLKLYNKADLFTVFYECGFEITGQYCDFEFHTSDNEFSNCYVELKKR